MPAQLALFSDSRTSKSIVEISLDLLKHSPYNTRATRPTDSIERLAGRISKNGYEITRAVWAHRVDGHYEVFAGGTRLEAARLAELQQIPVVVHEGFTDTEIVRLAEQDNEDDEYHTPVPVVDVWLSYKALADQGWTQEKIADAKGCSQPFVSARLKLADLPKGILGAFINNPLLNERAALEIVKLSTVDNLFPWLAREQAMLEIIDACESNPIARQFAKIVDKYNEFIELAQSAADTLDAYYPAFLSRLASKKARSRIAVQDEIDRLTKQIAEDKRRAEEEARIAAQQAEREHVEAARMARLVTEREAWFSKTARLYIGDFRTSLAGIADESVDLIFTDPPYDEQSIPLYGDLARLAARILKPNGSLICYAGHYAIPEILPLMTPHLRFWWMIALNHSGKIARLPGKWVFVHWKPLLWFVKGERRDNRYVSDAFKSNEPGKDDHEWQQDLSEATYYIEQLTDPGNTVCDPFCGSGTTLLAAVQLNRLVIGSDIAPGCIEATRGRLDEYYARQYDRA